MSNLLVQTIKHTNNTTSMSINTSGQVSIRGESSATTTNLQQGLAKHWTSIDGSGTVSLPDSFNTSGLTDVGTGNYQPAFTNNMNNSDYSVQLTSSVDHGVGFFFACVGDTSGLYPPPSTSNYQIFNSYTGTSINDSDNLYGTVHGDLA